MIVDSMNTIGNPKILEMVKELGRKAPQLRKRLLRINLLFPSFGKLRRQRLKSYNQVGGEEVCEIRLKLSFICLNHSTLSFLAVNNYDFQPLLSLV